MKRGLVILIPLLALLGFGCAKKVANDAKSGCEKAQYPFACVLDKAMAAKDVSICTQVEREKVMTCVEGYEEIIGSKVACEDLKNPVSISDCKLVRPTK
ncbi:MAG: hypothetical protein WCW31_02875 [Patescibacteria group bacterium]